MEHFPFFAVGKKYRVPNFLATSFSEDVAQGFLYNAFASGQTPVLWVVRVDPRGADTVKYRCKHVNYVKKSNVAGEQEFLFAPYSVFTVQKAYCPLTPSDDDPIRIELLAATDNLKEPEDLPLAPWS